MLTRLGQIWELDVSLQSFLFDIILILTDLPVVISDEEAAKSGLTANHTRRSSQFGGGYPVYVEGLHHLHCLVRYPIRILHQADSQVLRT